MTPPDARPAKAARGARKSRGSRSKRSRHRRACITTQASLRRGAEAGEQGAQASSQPGSSDRTCRSGSKGSRATSSSELHDLPPRRSYRERRHGGEGEPTPKKDHCRRKNRTSVAGDESRSGGARCARCMSLGRQRLCDRAPTPCRRERDFCCWRH